MTEEIEEVVAPATEGEEVTEGTEGEEVATPAAE
jgi:hypothetical protein